jgi:hypothetical protein
MNLDDFNGEDFEFHGERELHNTIICREYYPRVKVYYNKRTTEWFQVSEKGKVYRKTPPADFDEVVDFEKKWRKLD